MLGWVKDLKGEDNIQFEFSSISLSLCSVKSHRWYKSSAVSAISQKPCRTGLEKVKEKRVRLIFGLWWGRGKGTQSSCGRRDAMKSVQGQELGARRDYENVNPWEFTHILWEDLDFPEYSEWGIGPKDERNLRYLWVILSWFILYCTILYYTLPNWW